MSEHIIKETAKSIVDRVREFDKQNLPDDAIIAYVSLDLATFYNQMIGDNDNSTSPWYLIITESDNGWEIEEHYGTHESAWKKAEDKAESLNLTSDDYYDVYGGYTSIKEMREHKNTMIKDAKEVWDESDIKNIDFIGE